MGGAENELFHICRHDVVPLYNFNYVAPVLIGSDERFPPSMRLLTIAGYSTNATTWEMFFCWAVVAEFTA
jgi:hypothetical protein